MIIPEHFRKTAQHRALFATMEYLVAHDPVGPIVKGAHDREVTKAAVDRHRTVLEHRAADAFRAYFREERAHVVASVAAGRSGAAVVGELEPDLRETYEVAWGGAARAWGRWVESKTAAVRKVGPPDEPRDEAGKWIEAGGLTIREQNVEAPNDAIDSLKRRDHFYRGMTTDEYRATFGAGKGIMSRADWSILGEGTSFSDSPVDAESYVNFGSTDPRKTGKPTYLVEVQGQQGLIRSPEGYYKAQEEISRDRVTRIFRMNDKKGSIVAYQVYNSVRKVGPFMPGEPASDYGTPIDAWLRANAGKRITGITERSRKAIAAQIAEGQAAGETLRQIAWRIDKFYLEDVIPNRSMVIARTEVGGATNWMQHWIATDTADRGVPMEKEWLSLRDDRVRDDHAEANGQRQPLDEPFLVGGDELMYPGDESLGAGADEIINCRCSVLHHVVEEQPQHKAAAPSPYEFAKSVLGVQNDDVITALAFAKGVFGEADEWVRARSALMKHVHRLRRAISVEKYDPTELRDRLGRWATEGGGKFNGIQETGMPGKPGLALVTDLTTGSTGAIKLDEVSREKVHAKLREIRDRFATSAPSDT